MKAVSDEIHSMGMKFGLYGDAGTMTCAGYPGSQGYEDRDAKALASWGVDYWKHDNCYTPCNQGSVQTCGSPIGSTQQWYPKMRDALAASGRPIFYSLCNWGRDNVWTWGSSVGNSWRMSVDNWGNWAVRRTMEPNSSCVIMSLHVSTKCFAFIRAPQRLTPCFPTGCRSNRFFRCPDSFLFCTIWLQ